MTPQLAGMAVDRFIAAKVRLAGPQKSWYEVLVTQMYPCVQGFRGKISESRALLRLLTNESNGASPTELHRDFEYT
jgi:hypothetical protein